MVVEVMGRHSGWIATHAGIAGGATVVLIPERPFDIEEVCDRIIRRHQRGRFASIVVVAEGALPKEGTIEHGRHARSTGSATSGSAASATWWPRRSALAPASRRAPCCWVTSSAAARRPRSTGCCRPGSASPRSTPCTREAWGCMVALQRRPRSSHTPLVRRRRTDPPGRHVAVRRRRRDLLRLNGRRARSDARRAAPGYAGCDDCTKPG